MADDTLYSLDDCARRGGVSLSTIKREVVAGTLRATRIRGRVKVHPRDWEEYLEKCRSAGIAVAGKSASGQPGRKSVDLFAVAATLPNLNAALSKGSKIAALDDYRPTRSRKRSTAG